MEKFDLQQFFIGIQIIHVTRHRIFVFDVVLIFVPGGTAKGEK
jgi:hypothetical protein